MKKIVSLALTLVLLLGCLGTMTSCLATFVMGTYTYTDPLLGTETTYEFVPLNKVTKTAPKLLGTETTEGTYKIAEDEENPGEYLITFTWSDGETETMSFVKGTENGVDYIEMGDLITRRYIKAA